MPSEKNIEDLAKKSIEAVKNYFSHLSDDSKAILPSVFNKDGTWLGNFDEYSIGVFYLINDDMQRINGYINKGLSPFPGFFVSEQNRPANIPVAIRAGGSCNYFASNHTANLIAFEICPEASFTVVDHFHELKDRSGQEIKYRVNLAFFLGTLPDELWDKIEPRLLELLHYSLDVWKSIR